MTNSALIARMITRAAELPADDLAAIADDLADFLRDPIAFLTDDPSATADDFTLDDIDFYFRMILDNNL